MDDLRVLRRRMLGRPQSEVNADARPRQGWTRRTRPLRSSRLDVFDPRAAARKEASYAFAPALAPGNTGRHVTWFFAARCRLAGWRDGCDLRGATRAVRAP